MEDSERTWTVPVRATSSVSVPIEPLNSKGTISRPSMLSAALTLRPRGIFKPCMTISSVRQTYDEAEVYICQSEGTKSQCQKCKHGYKLVLEQDRGCGDRLELRLWNVMLQSMVYQWFCQVIEAHHGVLYIVNVHQNRVFVACLTASWKQRIQIMFLLYVSLHSMDTPYDVDE